MSGDKTEDERSMSEILSSIRRIVTDEERSRREADDARRTAESDAGVFVLTEEMRSAAPEAPAPAADDPSAPLELGAALAAKPAPQPDDGPLVLGGEDAAKPAPAAGVDFAAPPLSEEEIEAIVRRVVREELQGPIGQQISRKVKRLIREEVRAAIGEDEETLI